MAGVEFSTRVARDDERRVMHARRFDGFNSDIIGLEEGYKMERKVGLSS